MRIDTRTKKKFRNEILSFKNLIESCEELSDYFKYTVLKYSITNAYGALHFFLARNIRLIRTSYNLALEGKYTDAFIIIRTTMEGSLLSRYFTLNPKTIEDWDKRMNEILSEGDLKKKQELIKKKNKLYGPNAIRNKIADTNKKLYADLCNLYDSLCNYTHPSIMAEGEFLLKNKKKHIITHKPSFDEYLFIQWFRAASLTLATTPRMFEVMFRKGEFKHLGKYYILKLKKVTEQISDLMENRTMMSNQA